MKKRILAGLTASVLAAACAAQIPSILSASAAGSYDMQLKIQLDGEKKEISPYIYGVNESGNSNNLKSVKTNADAGDRPTSTPARAAPHLCNDLSAGGVRCKDP